MLNTDISPAVARLVELLCASSPQQVLTYQELSAAAGRSVLGARHLIASAKRICERDHGVVFGTERGVGVKRLAVDEIVNVGNRARAHIRSTARHAHRTIVRGTQGLNDLSPDQQRRQNAELTALALIEHVSTDRSVASRPDIDDLRPESVADLGRRLFAARR
jgi:hypothetical protein